MLVMVLTSSIFYYKNNYINWTTGFLCAIGGIAGGYIGAKILNKIPDYIFLIITGSNFKIFLSVIILIVYIFFCFINISSVVATYVLIMLMWSPTFTCHPKNTHMLSHDDMTCPAIVCRD